MEKLSPVELEILKYIADGGTQPQIAKKMRKSTSTIKNHAAAIRDKLGATTSAHAVALAIRGGLIQVA